METFIGDLELFAFNFAPYGWKICDGGYININDNQVLYALLGVRYGGDGRTTFAVPNLKNASPNPNMKYYIATQGLWPERP